MPMRIQNILKNCAFGFYKLLLTDVMKFIVRTVFIYRLSESFLGANGLFSNILNVLNIAELGIGGAIAYALYKPLAEQDTGQIVALMNLYRRAYRWIGLFIAVMGIFLIPWLPVLVKQEIPGLNLYVLYLLFLANSVVSYLFFSYKANLLTADQKNYLVNWFSSLVTVATALAQIAALLLLPTMSALSFYVYNILGIVGVVVSNLFVGHKVNQIYPFLRHTPPTPIPPEVKKKIFQNVGGLSIARISRVMLNSIDSIILSAAFQNGLSLIGRYSNYTMIVSVIDAAFTTISSSITASLGNRLIEGNGEKQEENLSLLYSMDILFKWFYGLCFVCLYVLLNPFIGGIWISEGWTLSETCVFLIALNFLLNGVIFAPMKFIQAAGLFWQARIRYIVSAVLNIGLSLLFGVVFRWGIEGVLLATSIALVGMTIRDPYIVFRHIFQKPCGRYYIWHITSVIGIILTGVLTNYLSIRFMPNYTLISFFFRMLLCVFLPNALWAVLLWKTPRFQNAKGLMISYIKVLKKKR